MLMTITFIEDMTCNYIRPGFCLRFPKNFNLEVSGNMLGSLDTLQCLFFSFIQERHTSMPHFAMFSRPRQVDLGWAKKQFLEWTFALFSQSSIFPEEEAMSRTRAYYCYSWSSRTYLIEEFCDS